jgi:multidrug efflux pump subunit AcrB
MSQAMAETVAYVSRSQAYMPPGTVYPFILRFDAGSVPVGNLVFSSATRSVGEIQDLALFKVRPIFASLPGVSAPPPMGGNQRTIVVNVNPAKLRQYHLSLDQIVQAISTGNAIAPSGNVGVGDKMLITPTNSVVPDIASLEDISLKPGNGATVYMRDVAWVEDSSDILSGYALINGKRTVYIPVTKRADASTWSVVQEVKRALPSMQNAIPSDMTISYEFDQSVYVKNALISLISEGIIGALLIGLMVFLFLRDVRSSLIIVLNIPIAILCSILVLWVSGQTINIMTLGGLALAIGILVDEGTVTMENIHMHLAQSKPIARAVLDSAQEIALPIFLAMVCILAVFVPSFFMTGAPAALFIPLSLAVGFAMMAAYVLSRTLVPVLVVMLLNPSEKLREGSRFLQFREKYTSILSILLSERRGIIIAYLIGSFAILAILSQVMSMELFPSVDGRQFRLRVRAPVGTRVERTEDITHAVLNTITDQVGKKNLEASLAFVGTQPSSYAINTIYMWSSGPHEALITVALKKGSGIRISQLKERLRKIIAEKFPELLISFEPGDLVGQVTNLGARTPIEVAIVGRNLQDDKAFADKLKSELSKIKKIRDLQFGEVLDYPALTITMDRMRAGQLGVTVNQISKALVPGTSSSRFTSQNYWLDKSTGTTYQVQVEVPQFEMRSAEDVEALPVIINPTSTGPFLRDVAMVKHDTVIGEFHRLNTMRILTLTANIAGNDLKQAGTDIQRAIVRAGEQPRGMKVLMRSQAHLLLETVSDLQGALLIAVLAIFLLLAANFQSFTLSLLSLATVPAVLVGSGLMLLLTGTSLNIQSYLGMIMAIGVSVSNSILLITFAEDLRQKNGDAFASAIEGSAKRLRPILMTAIAMIAGMVPMALALGESGEQTAPLGRAVIGGVLASTFATLLITPLIFSVLRQKSSTASFSLNPDDPNNALYEASKERS